MWAHPLLPRTCSCTEKLDDDADLYLTGSCSQSQALFGEYSYFLFDLEQDPFETDNLYYSQEDDDAQSALVGIINTPCSMYAEFLHLCRLSCMRRSAFMRTHPWSATECKT